MPRLERVEICPGIVMDRWTMPAQGKVMHKLIMGDGIQEMSFELGIMEMINLAGHILKGKQELTDRKGEK